LTSLVSIGTVALRYRGRSAARESEPGTVSGKAGKGHRVTNVGSWLRKSAFGLIVAAGVLVAFALTPALADAQGPGGLAQLGNGNSCIATNDSEECPATSDGLEGTSDVAVSPDGSDVYVLGYDDDAIAEFQRNGDGSLQPLDTDCIADSSADGTCDNDVANGLVDPEAIAISPDGLNVYVAARDSEGDGTIAEFARDPDSGELTQLSPNDCIAENKSVTDETSDCGNQSGHGIEQPDALVVSPDGQNVYAVSSDGDSVAEFTRNSNGSLSQLNGDNDCISEESDNNNNDCGSTDGLGMDSIDAVAITPDGGNVYTGSDDNPGGIAEFQRNGDGSLSEISCIQEPDESDECGDNTGPGLNYVTSLAVSPDGQNLYSTSDDGDDAAIAEFSITGDGSLSQLGNGNACIQESEGNDECGDNTGVGLDGAASVAISPDGADVYVATNEDDCCESAIAEFSRSSSDGSLTQLPSPDSCISEGEGDCGENDNAVGLGGGELAVSPDGSNVYAIGNDDVAEFSRTPPQYTLTVSPGGSGSGSVTSGDESIDCPDTCSNSYSEGTSVTLTETPAAGSTFTGWGGACSGTGTTCQVSMYSDTDVTATFTATATLTVSLAGTGSGAVSDGTGGIACPSNCSNAYPQGTVVTLTALAASGSTFGGWSGACSGTGSCQLTMSSDMAVTATFTPAPSGPTAEAPTPVLTSKPAAVTDSGAGFSGTVNPEGLPTTVYFQYGLDKRYSQPGTSGPNYTAQTAAQSVGDDFTTTGIGPVTVSGLVPNALYHVRLVATNSDGTTFGDDVTFTTAAGPAPGPPTLGETFNIAPVSGLVLILIHGHFVPLTEGLQIGPNVTINTLHGTLQLTSATGLGLASDAAAKGEQTQTGQFGGAVIRVHQTKSGRSKGMTTVMMIESAYKGAPGQSVCKAPAGDAQAARASSKVIQLLHASAHGKFTTSGRYSAATVRGTKWTMSAQCNGTLTHDVTDSVEVHDFVRHRTIILHAGQSYLAPGPFKKP
jgi:6-phosphogluconolactonase (cycloisomerase 2 family)